MEVFSSKLFLFPRWHNFLTFAFCQHLSTALVVVGEVSVYHSLLMGCMQLHDDCVQQMCLS